MGGGNILCDTDMVTCTYTFDTAHQIKLKVHVPGCFREEGSGE